MDPKPITINDVAREAGVSIATVSRVLSGGSASAAAREKVMAAARALGYHKTTVSAPGPNRRRGWPGGR